MEEEEEEEDKDNAGGHVWKNEEMIEIRILNERRRRRPNQAEEISPAHVELERGSMKRLREEEGRWRRRKRGGSGKG